jgi:hypothetical protein
VRPSRGLAAGTYNATVTVDGGSNITARSFDVRFTVTTSASESAVTTTATVVTAVTTTATTAGIPDATVTPTRGITLSQTSRLTFPNAVGEYGEQIWVPITVTNNGTAATGALEVVVTGNNPEAFSIQGRTGLRNGIDAGESRTFDVRPSRGLSPGMYNATVSVTGGTGITARSFEVQFFVDGGEVTAVTSTPPTTVSAVVPTLPTLPIDTTTVDLTTATIASTEPPATDVTTTTPPTADTTIDIEPPTMTSGTYDEPPATSDEPPATAETAETAETDGEVTTYATVNGGLYCFTCGDFIEVGGVGECGICGGNQVTWQPIGDGTLPTPSPTPPPTDTTEPPLTTPLPVETTQSITEPTTSVTTIEGESGSTVPPILSQPDSAPTVNDALEILKYIVGLPSVYDGTRQTPTVDDAMEILKFVAGLPSVYDKIYR